MSLRIQMAAPQDAPDMRAIYAPIVRDTPTSFELAPPSEEEMAARISSALTRYPWLVCAARERLLGYAYAGAHNARAAYQWSVNVSVYVHPQARRLGVGRALYHTLFAILRLQGFYRAYAGITLPNPASVGLHESFGFTPAGVFERVRYKLGAWRDVGYWQLALQHRIGEPALPQPLPTLMSGMLQQELQQELKAGSDSLARHLREIPRRLNTGQYANAK